MSLAKSETLLLAEFDQAWAHYRHAETTRTAHLGFLFTVTLGSAAAAAAALPTGKLGSSTNFALTLFLAIYLVFVSFEYAVLRKLDFVMSHYEGVWNRIRHHFYRHVDPEIEPFASLDVRRSKDPMMTGRIRRRLLRTQTATEITLIAMALLASAGEVVLLVQASVAQESPWVLAGRSAIAFVGITVVILTIVVLGSSIRAHHSTESS